MPFGDAYDIYGRRQPIGLFTPQENEAPELSASRFAQIAQMAGGASGLPTATGSPLGTYTGLGATIGSVVPGLGTLAGTVVGGVADVLNTIFGGMLSADKERKERRRQERIRALQLVDQLGQGWQQGGYRGGGNW